MPQYGSKSNSTSVAEPKLRVRSGKRLKKFSTMLRTDNVRFTVTGRSGSQKNLQLQWSKIVGNAATRLLNFTQVADRARSAGRLLKLARRVRPFGAQAEVRFQDRDTKARHESWANILQIAAQRLLADSPRNLATALRYVEDRD